MQELERKLKTVRKALAYRLSAHRRAYYLGWTGHKNLGDEAIYQALDGYFRELPLAQPEDSKPLRLIEHLIGPGIHPLAILGGGTLIGEKGMLGPFEKMIKRGRRIIAFGTGVEDPRFWQQHQPERFDIKPWVPLLKQCAYVGVRGPLSQQFLAEEGLNVGIMGDPAAWFVREQEYWQPDGQTIGVNIGTTPGAMWGGEELLYEKMLAFVRDVLKRGFRVRLYVVWPADMPVTLRLAKDVGIDPHEIVCVYEDTNAFLEAVRGLQALVAVKLHAAILGTCAGVPSILVEYRPKCRDYMASVDLARFAVRIDTIMPEQMISLLEEVIRDGKRISEHAISRLQEFKKMQTEIAAKIVSEN